MLEPFISHGPLRCFRRFDHLVPSHGNVSFVRRAGQFTSVGDEKEAFYLRVYGAGQYRYYGADLGILVSHGRFQTDQRTLIDRAKLWNAGIKAQFHGIAPTPDAPPVPPQAWWGKMF